MDAVETAELIRIGKLSTPQPADRPFTGVRTTWGTRGGSECLSKRTDKIAGSGSITV